MMKLSDERTRKIIENEIGYDPDTYEWVERLINQALAEQQEAIADHIEHSWDHMSVGKTIFYDENDKTGMLIPSCVIREIMKMVAKQLRTPQ